MSRIAASRSFTERRGAARRASWLAVLLALPGAASGQGYEPGDRSVEGRLARVERLLDNRGLLDLLTEVEKLNREIKRLRGEIEVQRHAMDRQTARQERLYTDLDVRLESIERGAPAQKVAEQGAAELPPGAPAASTPSEMPASGIEPASSRAAEVPSAAGLPEGGENPSAGATAPPIVATAAASEESSYQASFDFLKTGQYDKSIQSFGDFLTRFPQSPHADNAQYWLAEAYYVTHRYEPAISEYQKLVASYPESQKLTHALLKVGYSYHELGQIPEARQSLEDLKQRYPGTTAARLAEERLQRIGLEH